MRRWALVTVGLYAAVLLFLASPVAYAAFQSQAVGLEIYWFPGLWIWVGLMMLAQWALLAVPVLLESRRPVTRMSLVWSLLAAFVMLLVLAAGMFAVAWETLAHMIGQAHGATVGSAGDDTVALVVFGAVGVVWLLWAVLFGFYCGRSEPKALMSRVTRFLVAGSILELLVAVPAHVYARWKDHCCGGMLTVWGLAAGISVMLFAFGPAVFVLFARRVASKRASERQCSNATG
jgi:hypothetical protein